MSHSHIDQKENNKKSITDIIRNYFFKVNPVDYSHHNWEKWELILFRFFFIFLSILIIPVDWKIFRDILSVNWFQSHLHDFFRLSKYQNEFINSHNLPIWGIAAFANWGFAFVIALAGTIIWSYNDRSVTDYNVLYYWLRVIVRYRLAFVLITYGFIKFFPLQMPFPSLSNLHTNYGDYYPWKIYFQTVGIAPRYQSFLGFVEILAAFLIINRRTVTFGVGLIFGFIGNVAVVNGFYDVGEIVTSTFIVLLSVFLFSYDIPRLYRLLIHELPTKGNQFIPNYSNQKLRTLRTTLRSLFLLFVLIFAYKSYDSYAHDPYKVPKTPGLSNAHGYYNVKTYVLNNDTISYSLIHPTRWHDVIFEKWSTISVKSNKPVDIDFGSGEVAAKKDIDRNYELAGLSGRHYYYYEIDSVKNILNLQNKNINHRNEKFSLSFDRPNDTTIILKGRVDKNDSIYVVLEKEEKKYMMFEGRRRPVKL